MEKKLTDNNTSNTLKPVNNTPVASGTAEANGDIPSGKSGEKKRLPIFDNFRGLIIFLTIIFNFMHNLPVTPFRILHAPEYINSVHFKDIGVVAFIAVLSFLFSHNFQSKAKRMKLSEVYRFYILKSFVLIGFGFTFRFFEVNFIDSGLTEGVHTTNFNVFVSYGFMTLFSLLFIQLKSLPRLIIGSGLIAVHQFVILNNAALTQSIIDNSQGGIVAILSWVGLCLIASAIGDYYFKDKKKFYAATLAVIGVGIIYVILNLSVSNEAFLAQIFLNKRLATAGYIFVSLAVTLCAFVIFDQIDYLSKRSIPLISEIGQSALFFFVLGGLLDFIIKGFFSLTFGDLLFREGIAAAAAGITAVLLTGLLTLTAAWVFRKCKIRIVL